MKTLLLSIAVLMLLATPVEARYREKTRSRTTTVCDENGCPVSSSTSFRTSSRSRSYSYAPRGVSMGMYFGPQVSSSVYYSAPRTRWYSSAPRVYYQQAPTYYAAPPVQSQQPCPNCGGSGQVSGPVYSADPRAYTPAPAAPPAGRTIIREKSSTTIKAK